MRTTVNIEDHLLAQAKQAAIREGCSLGKLVGEALRQFLTGPRPCAPSQQRVELPEGGEGGVLPGVDIDDAADLLLAIESGCDWITTDQDFAHFPGLTWRHPLDASNPDTPV